MSPAEAQLITVARGTQPADLLFCNARIVNVFNGEIEDGNVAIYGKRIAGIGDYTQAKQIIDLGGKYLAPGLIDGHVHLESSMLDVGEYARVVVPHGTTAIITDLHEIANVSGTAGVQYILEAAQRLPLELFLMAPSCVPATNLETAGASVNPAEIRQMLRWHNCIGLGEVMNYPGVLDAEATVMEKLKAAGRKAIDGHAPGLSGKGLNAYATAGIHSDHESVLLKEAQEKLRRGMYVMIREGSSEKNLEALLPLVTDETYKRCFFVVDDRNCTDLLNDGDMDAVIRKAIRLGLEPVRAIQLATINTAEYFRLDEMGAIAPGYLANLIILDNLTDFQVEQVFYNGKPAAEKGRPLFQATQQMESGLRNTIRVKNFTRESLELKGQGGNIPIIEVVPGQIVTRKRAEVMKPVNGTIQPDTRRDILKLAVIERHKATGNIGLGLVSGFGLKKGALASSISHDSHNIIAVGTNDDDIMCAVKQIVRQQGGLAVTAERKVLASLALPVAGLLSDKPLEEVAASMSTLEIVVEKLGGRLPSAFATLSFLALPVIPELRLTDMGLVDVNKFELIKRW